MKIFEIKVTGSGTKNEIGDALRQLATSIETTSNMVVSREFEDAILMTEIIEADPKKFSIDRIQERN